MHKNPRGHLVVGMRSKTGVGHAREPLEAREVFREGASVVDVALHAVRKRAESLVDRRKIGGVDRIGPDSVDPVERKRGT